MDIQRARASARGVWMFSLIATGATGQCESGWNPEFTPTVFNGRVEGGVLFRGPVQANVVVYGEFRWDGGGADQSLAAWNGTDWRELPGGFHTSGPVLHADTDRTPARIIAARWYDDVGIFEDGRWRWVEPPYSRGRVYAVLTGPDAQSDDIYVAGSTYIDTERVSVLSCYDGETWTELGTGFGRSVVDMEWFDDGSGVMLYATGQEHGYGDPDELGGFGRWTGKRWEPIAQERSVRPIHLCRHDEGMGPKLFGMNYDILTVWDGDVWEEFELREYTETSLGSLVSVETAGRRELIWGGNSHDDDVGRLWRWNGDAEELLGEADGEIHAVIADHTGELGGGVFVVGEFRHINGVSAVNVAQWDGIAWRAVGTAEQGNGAWLPDRLLTVGPDAAPKLANRVFVATIADAGGRDCGGLATWDGNRWECIGDGGMQNLGVWHMLHTEWEGRERIIVAGRVGPTYDDSGVAMWDGDTWEYIPSPFDAVSRDIRAFAIGELDGHRAMIAGGRFNDHNTLSGGLFVYDGQAWSRFGKGFNEPPSSAVFFDDGTGSALYVSGRFTIADGRPVAQVARWNGRRWEQVGDGMTNNGYPQGTTLQVVDTGEGPRLYITGRITHSGGTRLYNIGVWNGEGWKPVGTNLATWPPDDLFALETADGPLLAAIAPRNNDGVFTHRVMTWSGHQWQVLEDRFNAPIQGVSVSPTNPRIFYLGGYFTRIGDTPSGGFAEYIPSARICTADFDCNGIRDSRDIVEYAGAWAAGEPRADLDGNGEVTKTDFVIFLAEWRFGC